MFVALQKKFPSDFAVLAFPCNQFMKQEPGTAEQIRQKANGFGFERHLFAKGDVKGKNAQPLWSWLNAPSRGSGAPGWNFGKNIIGRDGKWHAYVGPRDADLDKTAAIIEPLLAEKPPGAQSPSGVVDPSAVDIGMK